jgi:hypothetical protein
MNKLIKKTYKARMKDEISRDQWLQIANSSDPEEVTEVIRELRKIENRLHQYLDGFHYRTKIRKYANNMMWSDIEPYEVVKIVSDKCVEIRPMQTKQIVFPKEFHIGGFSAHCSDNWNQKYEYSSDPTAPTMRIRKGKKGWKSGSLKFQMSNNPIKHYDYNF